MGTHFEPDSGPERNADVHPEHESEYKPHSANRTSDARTDDTGRNVGADGKPER